VRRLFGKLCEKVQEKVTKTRAPSGFALFDVQKKNNEARKEGFKLRGLHELSYRRGVGGV